MAVNKKRKANSTKKKNKPAKRTLKSKAKKTKPKAKKIIKSVKSVKKAQKRKSAFKQKASSKKSVYNKKIVKESIINQNETKMNNEKKEPEKQSEINPFQESIVAESAKKGEIIFSVIIPAYNEEKRIGNTLLAIDKYLSRMNFPYEILIVIDGAKDNTFSVVEKYQKMVKNLKILNNPENHGKGYVVRQGMLAAKGVYRLFMDADNSTTIDQIEKFSPYLEDEEVGLVIGSRDIKGSDVKKHQPKWKELFGDMGNLMIQFVGGLWGIRDTQCGFKIMTGKAAEVICPMMRINRWGFDIEMLVLTKKLGFKIQEVPVVWINDEASKVTLGGYINTLKELFTIRLGLWTGKYDLKGAKEKKEANN